MKRIYEQTVNAPSMPVVAKASSRATVTYDDYVFKYAAAIRLNAFLVFAGVAVTIAAGIWIPAPGAYFVGALGLGVGIGGAFGVAALRQSHREYHHDLAVAVSETYAQPEPRPAPATVRPFVASENGAGRTTNTGRLNFTPEVWRNLFNLALRNGGEINRDDVAKPALSREWYHGAGYGALLRELSHMGFIDERKRLTPAALSWYEQQIALPLDAIALRSPYERTNGANERGQGE